MSRRTWPRLPRLLPSLTGRRVGGQFTQLIGPPGSIVPYFGAPTGMPATAGWGPCRRAPASCRMSVCAAAEPDAA
jgi:hypothetical protein